MEWSGTALDDMRKVNAQIRYYFKENPDTLSDEEWACRVVELEWIRTEEAKANRM